MAVPLTPPPALTCYLQPGDLRCLTDWAFLASNPGVLASVVAIVGTLIAGALTLIGVGITLRFNRIKMIADLAAAESLASASRAFSAQQAINSHLTELRKALYATLIEEHQSAIAALFGMSSLPLREALDTVMKISPYTSAVQKTLIISGAQTSKLAREVHSQIMAAIFALMPHVAKLAPYKAMLERANLELNTRVAAMQALIESAKASSSTAPKDAQDIQAAAKVTLAEFQAATATRDKLAAESSAALAEFHAALNQHVAKVSERHTEFLSLARAELGIAGDPIQQHEVQEDFQLAQAGAKDLKRALGLSE